MIGVQAMAGGGVVAGSGVWGGGLALEGHDRQLTPSSPLFLLSSTPLLFPASDSATLSLSVSLHSLPATFSLSSLPHTP